MWREKSLTSGLPVAFAFVFVFLGAGRRIGLSPALLLFLRLLLRWFPVLGRTPPGFFLLHLHLLASTKPQNVTPLYQGSPCLTALQCNFSIVFWGLSCGGCQWLNTWDLLSPGLIVCFGSRYG